MHHEGKKDACAEVVTYLRTEEGYSQRFGGDSDATASRHDLRRHRQESQDGVPQPCRVQKNRKPFV